MRVLVATDRIGSLSSARAGLLLATGWPAADVTVVPVGESGDGFLDAAADQLAADVTNAALGENLVSVASAGRTTLVALESADPSPSPDIPLTATSAELGRAAAHALDPRGRVRQLVVDLAGPVVHDGGAGLLAALGASADVPLDRGVARLAGITTLELDVARGRLAGVDLVGVVPSRELAQPLLGLRGITSLRRTPHLDPAELLWVDAALTAFAELAAPEHASRPGAGACGGLGFAILALGGRLVTGPAYTFEQDTVRPAVAATDLVVTGCTVFDFARRGGGVVAAAAEVATAQLCPCIAVAVEVLIGGREMRTMGIESAYPVREARAAHGSDVSEEELMATARRIGRSWRW